MEEEMEPMDGEAGRGGRYSLSSAEAKDSQAEVTRRFWVSFSSCVRKM